MAIKQTVVERGNCLNVFRIEYNKRTFCRHIMADERILSRWWRLCNVCFPRLSSTLGSLSLHWTNQWTILASLNLSLTAQVTRVPSLLLGDEDHYMPTKHCPWSLQSYKHALTHTHSHTRAHARTHLRTHSGRSRGRIRPEALPSSLALDFGPLQRRNNV